MGPISLLAFNDGLLVEGGVLKFSYRRWSMQMVVREQIAGLVAFIPFRVNAKRGDDARAVQDVSKPGFMFLRHTRGNFRFPPVIHLHFRGFWRDRYLLPRPSSLLFSIFHVFSTLIITWTSFFLTP